MRLVKSIFVCLVFFVFEAKSQISPGEVLAKIDSGLTKFISIVNLKDSIATYTGAVEVRIFSKGKTQKIEVYGNSKFLDTILDERYVPFLKSIDFSSLMKKKSYLELVIPIACFATNFKDSKNLERQVSLSSLPSLFENFYGSFSLNNNRRLNRLYLKPIIVTVDKTIYD